MVKLKALWFNALSLQPHSEVTDLNLLCIWALPATQIEQVNMFNDNMADLSRSTENMIKSAHGTEKKLEASWLSHREHFQNPK